VCPILSQVDPLTVVPLAFWNKILSVTLHGHDEHDKAYINLARTKFGDPQSILQKVLLESTPENVLENRDI
jgi:hypothetical protein